MTAPSTASTEVAQTFRERIAAEAQRTEEDALYASKAHYNDADKWNRLHLWLGGAATVLAAAAGATGLLGDNATLAAFVSFASAGVTAVLTFQKPSERASSHRVAGAGYAQTRRMARQLRSVDVHGDASDEELRRMLATIGEGKDTLDRDSPVYSRRAFQSARKGIEEGEASHVVDQKERR